MFYPPLKVMDHINTSSKSNLKRFLCELMAGGFQRKEKEIEWEWQPQYSPVVSLLQTKGATDNPSRRTEDHGNLGKC